MKMLQRLRTLLSIRGRVGRLRFWLTYIAAILGITFSLVFLEWARDFTDNGARLASAIFALVTGFLAFWMAVSVIVRRLHDRDWSGRWVIPLMLIGLVSNLLDQPGIENFWVRGSVMAATIIGSLFALIELGVRRGTAGGNRFGPDPLASKESVAEAFD
jgi:uncharacterized membrane protein YhaH (DUF805 family)